jgi:hypothetical protein
VATRVLAATLITVVLLSVVTIGVGASFDFGGPRVDCGGASFDLEGSCDDCGGPEVEDAAILVDLSAVLVTLVVGSVDAIPGIPTDVDGRELASLLVEAAVEVATAPVLAPLKY